MKRENTAIRLRKLMDDRNIRQVDILNLCEPYCRKYDVKMNKSDISQYLSGKSEPGQDKLVVLGMALNVNEAWLMGFDVPVERNSMPQSSEDPLVNAILNSKDNDSDLDAEILKRKITNKYELKSIDYSLLTEFKKLNKSGKTEAVNRVRELTYIPQYTDADFFSIKKKKPKYVPTEEDIQSLVARNGKKFTREEAIEFISDMLSDDEDDE